MDEENEDLTPEETEEIDENPEETPGEAHREGEFDDLRDRSFVIALFCEQLPCCIHDVLFCMSFAVRCHN